MLKVDISVNNQSQRGAREQLASENDSEDREQEEEAKGNAEGVEEDSEQERDGVAIEEQSIHQIRFRQQGGHGLRHKKDTSHKCITGGEDDADQYGAPHDGIPKSALQHAVPG